jgi:hypothetical protein
MSCYLVIPREAKKPAMPINMRVLRGSDTI